MDNILGELFTEYATSLKTTYIVCPQKTSLENWISLDKHAELTVWEVL